MCRPQALRAELINCVAATCQKARRRLLTRTAHQHADRHGGAVALRQRADAERLFGARKRRDDDRERSDVVGADQLQKGRDRDQRRRLLIDAKRRVKAERRVRVAALAVASSAKTNEEQGRRETDPWSHSNAKRLQTTSHCLLPLAAPLQYAVNVFVEKELKPSENQTQEKTPNTGCCNFVGTGAFQTSTLVVGHRT